MPPSRPGLGTERCRGRAHQRVPRQRELLRNPHIGRRRAGRRRQHRPKLGFEPQWPECAWDTDLDVTILKIDLAVPEGANCLSFDFKFLSDEFPEWVNTEYNDAFIAELGTSTWTTSGSTISAPDNFAFDPSGDVISINSSGNTAMSDTEASGTTYDGATPRLSAATQVTPGAHSLVPVHLRPGRPAFTTRRSSSTTS